MSQIKYLRLSAISCHYWVKLYALRSILTEQILKNRNAAVFAAYNFTLLVSILYFCESMMKFTTQNFPSYHWLSCFNFKLFRFCTQTIFFESINSLFWKTFKFLTELLNCYIVLTQHLVMCSSDYKDFFFQRYFICYWWIKRS